MPKGVYPRKLKSPSERFWRKVDISGGPDACWPWLGGTIGRGYGEFHLGGKTLYAHRFAYELLVDSIPDGLTIDHLCRNRVCVNTRHLEIVTMRINVLRGESVSARHAVKAHCPQGHPYDLINTHYTSSGARQCRMCHAAAERRRKHALRSHTAKPYGA